MGYEIKMSSPDFTNYGYQVTELLNSNSQGGRITYKAIEINTQKPVVIKQFRFATGGNWTNYKEIEREIKVLKELDHAGIPKYLNQFNPNDGICLVQEYKDARPLSLVQLSSASKAEIEDISKNIAFQILDILIYLQDRVPLIIHRDIKPENILVDYNLKVYLVDFGLARIGNHTMAFSSMMGGTLGFMPPEQVQAKELTKASDLYGLGATLICLITQTKSSDIGSLVSFDTNKITFRNQASQFSSRFIQWLEKMVEPNPNNRYQSAKLALTALQNINSTRISQVALSNPPYLWLLGWFMLVAIPTSILTFIRGWTFPPQISIPIVCGLFGFGIAMFGCSFLGLFGVKWEEWNKYTIASFGGAGGGIILWILIFISSPQNSQNNNPYVSQGMFITLKIIEIIYFAILGVILPLFITLSSSFHQESEKIFLCFFKIITKPYVWLINNIFNLFDERRYRKLFSISSFLLVTFLAIATGVGTAIGFQFYVVLSLLITGLPLTVMFCYSFFKMRRLKV